MESIESMSLHVAADIQKLRLCSLYGGLGVSGKRFAKSWSYRVSDPGGSKGDLLLCPRY